MIDACMQRLKSKFFQISSLDKSAGKICRDEVRQHSANHFFPCGAKKWAVYYEIFF